MKYLFVGAGAIGTYIGGSLAARGEDVSFIEQPAVADLINERGLIIRRDAYTTTVRSARAFTSAADALATDHDVVVFALKSFDTVSALDALLAPGLPVPPVLSLQNGVDNEPTIAARLGANRVIAGTVTSAVAKPGVGEVIEETHRGVGIALGHELSERLVASLQHAGLTTRAYAEAGSMKWSKLLTNLIGNASSAILDLNVGQIVADPRLFDLELAAIREALAVMAALGHRPVDLPGTTVAPLALAVKVVPRFVLRPAMTKMLASGRGDKMPSFHIDLHSGRGRTEVDYLNGAVVRHGERVGVPTPVNRVLTETLTGLTDGTLALADFRRNPDALLRLLP